MITSILNKTKSKQSISQLIKQTIKSKLSFSNQINKENKTLSKIKPETEENSEEKVRKVGNDEIYWKEYKARLKERKDIPLTSQEVYTNKVNYNWEFSNNHSISAIDLWKELEKIEIHSKEKDIPYVITDVREESEIKMMPFPIRNKKKGVIPYNYTGIENINRGDYFGIPKDKYVIVVDTIGLRSRRVATILNQEGYMSLYCIGGVDMLFPLFKKYWDV